MEAWIDSVMPEQRPDVGEPECFALDPEEMAAACNQPIQSIPRAPTLCPAPPLASWRGDAPGTRLRSHPSVSSLSSIASARRGSNTSFTSFSSTTSNADNGSVRPSMSRSTSMSYPDSEDVVSMSELEGYDFQCPQFPYASVNPGLLHVQLGGMGAQSQAQSQGQMQGGMGMPLAIDPNLFRPRHGQGQAPSGAATTTFNGGQMVDSEIGEQYDEDLVTAKPKVKAKSKSKSTIKTKTTTKTRIGGDEGDYGQEEDDNDDDGDEGDVEVGAARSSGKKTSHARKQNPNHIPRPRNAFILFRKHVVDSKLIPASVEVRHQNVSVIVAKMWAEASAEQKAEFAELARVEKEDHLKKYPGYRYQPVYRRTNVIRRRVRKDEAEEERCKSVAELLLRGKSGDALEEGIKEKMSKEERFKRAKRASQANELSKGALRALRAQAKLAETRGSDEWTDASRAGSAAPSRSVSRSTSVDASDNGDGVARYDSVPPYVASDGMTQSHEMQLQAQMQMQVQMHVQQMQQGQQSQMYGNMVDQFGQFGDEGMLAPSFSFNNGQGSVFGGDMGFAPVQQTYAYPEPIAHYTQQQQTSFAYPQPTLGGFYSYDQALPFSPTAHSYGFDTSMDVDSSMNTLFDNTLSGNNASNDMSNYIHPASQIGSSSLTMDDMLTIGSGMDMKNDQSNMFTGSGSGLFNTLPVPPMTAKWSMSFQTGSEGMMFDDSTNQGNPLLHDFGAALMQAEEILGW